MNQLKIRGSYGKVGNDKITPNNDIRFLYLTTITKDANTAWFGSSQQAYKGYDEGQIGVTDVTWESSFKKNIGLMQSFSICSLCVRCIAKEEREC